MVLIFVGVAVGVGIYCRRTTKSVDGFVLGGRNVGPWMSAFAFGTSYFSAVVFVGYAGQFGWKYGIAAAVGRHRQRHPGQPSGLVGAGAAHARDDAPPGRAPPCRNSSAKRYRSKGLRIAAAAIIFVFLIPYTASVYNGLSRLFGMAFGLPYEACVIGMAAVTCIYVVHRRLHGHGHERLSAGHRHAAGHRRGHRGRAGEQRRASPRPSTSCRAFRPICPAHGRRVREHVRARPARTCWAS